MCYQKLYGLIGKKLEHSLSEHYFKNKFSQLQLLHSHSYKNYELETLEHFPELLKSTPSLVGLNVTIPYKEKIIKYLDKLDTHAQNIKAVNVITINRTPKIKLKGYNTDFYGIQNTLKNTLKSLKIKALILGTGGAAKATTYALENIKIPYNLVSRKLQKNVTYTYKNLSEKIIQDHLLIINTTPLGMFPKINTYPDIPYNYLSEKHTLFDLIYNPTTTIFLKNAKQAKATIINGMQMFTTQAEQTWKIFNKKT